MPSNDLASRAPPAHPTGEPGGPPGAGRVVPAERGRGPGARRHTLVRSSNGDLTPETADRHHTERRHRTPGFLEEAATQNAERLHGPPRTLLPWRPTPV